MPDPVPAPKNSDGSQTPCSSGVLTNSEICPSDYRRELLVDSSGLAEAIAVPHASGVTAMNYRPEQMPLTQGVALVVERIRAILADPQRGAVIVEAGEDLSVEGAAADRARLLTVMLGTQFGITVTKTLSEPHPFFSVRDEKGGDREKYLGNALSNNRPGIHTDGSGLPDAEIHVMGLLCIRPAFRGGESILVNALDVFDSLPNDVQEHLLTRHFVRQSPYDKNDPNPVRRPIYQQYSTAIYTGLGIRYHRSRIEGGHQRVSEPLTPRDLEVLDLLDQRLNDPKYRRDFMLRSGDLLLLNNMLLCHDRYAFEDKGAPRYLERYWSGRRSKESLAVG